MGTETRGLNENEFENYIFTLRTCDKALLPYAAVSALVIGMGARVGEVLALTVADVIEGGKVRLSIKRKISKNEKNITRLCRFLWSRLVRLSSVIMITYCGVIFRARMTSFFPSGIAGGH